MTLAPIFFLLYGEKEKKMRWQWLSVRSAAIGMALLYISISFINVKRGKKGEDTLIKNARAYEIKNDNGSLDTVIVIPVKASQAFNGRTSKLIEEGKIKVVQYTGQKF